MLFIYLSVLNTFSFLFHVLYFVFNAIARFPPLTPPPFPLRLFPVPFQFFSSLETLFVTVGDVLLNLNWLVVYEVFNLIKFPLQFQP